MSESNELSLLKDFSSIDLSGISNATISTFDGILAIRDRIYLSKLKEFWRAPEDHKIKIEEFVRKTKDQQDWQKVGKNFLLVIDAFSAFDKCYYYGKVWIAWLEKEINTQEMIDMTSILEAIFPSVLQKLMYGSLQWSEYDQGRIESCGIARQVSGFVSDQEAQEMASGQPHLLTNIGEKFIKILKI